MLRHITMPVTLSIFTALAIAAPGCTQKGSMTAVESGGATPGAAVVMDWESPEGERVTGTLTATLPSGETFSGKYIQVGTDTSDSDLEPYWSGWSGSQWGTWPQDYSATVEGSPSFQMQYSDRVIANLTGDKGGKMRCRFKLHDSVAGLAGGGMGQCQTGAGDEIEARFPKQTD